MIEYYGWVNIRESFDETNENDKLLKTIWQTFLQEVNRLFTHSSNPQIKATILNGQYHFIISGFHNHKSQDFSKVFTIFEWLEKHAVGSYGLLYFFDDEDTDGYHNQFQVYCLKKGKFERQKDTFLSPYFNKVEM